LSRNQATFEIRMYCWADPEHWAMLCTEILCTKVLHKIIDRGTLI
jgi:hypothetical protein